MSHGDSAAGLAGFAARAATLSWFASLGTPLSAAERDDARTHMAGLGMPALPIATVPDWEAARQAASLPVGEPDCWWAAEERLRLELLDAAGARHGTSALLAALSEVTRTAAEPTLAGAAMAATRSGITNPEMIRAAAGAGAQAVYLAALAEAAGHDVNHPFAAKLRLFAAGRWPLGIVAGRVLVF